MYVYYVSAVGGSQQRSRRTEGVRGPEEKGEIREEGETEIRGKAPRNGRSPLQVLGV